MKSLNDEVSFQVVHSWKYHCSEVELRETQLIPFPLSERNNETVVPFCWD